MRRSFVLLLVIAAALGVTASDAGAARWGSCPPVRNPYPRTQYAGIDLTHIQALRISCATARGKARAAQQQALGRTQTGVWRFRWQGWSVTAELWPWPGRDRYVAEAGIPTRGVRWSFRGADVTFRSCPPVRNPYPNTRYADVDLTHIEALRVSCTTARNVARGAHHRALATAPPVSGIRRFSWQGWHVTGDLRPTSDRYVATRGRARVRWRF